MKMKNTNYNYSIINDYQAATENNPYQRVIVTPHLLDSMGDISHKSILDVGCGFGRHIKFILQNSSSFDRIVGIDKSEDQIMKCKETFRLNSKLEFHTADISSDNIFQILEKNSFDIIYNNFVITYCADINEVEKFLKNCFDLLNKGGKFILIYNNHKNGLEINKKVYDVLKADARPLTENSQFYEGCPMESIMSKDCSVKLNYFSDEFIADTMKRLGYSDVEVKNIYLKEKAMVGYSQQEVDVIIDSRIFILITAKKL